jgi:hypothetical protein
MKSKKNQNVSHYILGFQKYHNATVIKIVCPSIRNRYIDLWNKTESPKHRITLIFNRSLMRTPRTYNGKE